MRTDVRLAGTDAAVRAVAREAVDLLRRAQGSAALFGGLWNLHHSRRRFLASARTAEQLPAPDAAGGRHSGRTYRVIWGILLGIGLAGAVAAASMLGPPDRKNRYTDVDSAFVVAVVGAAVALLFLLVVLLLRVPDPRAAEGAEMVAVVTGILCVVILAFRLVAGTGDGRGFGTDDLAIWIPMMTGIVLLLGGIALRCDPVRRQARPPHPVRASAPSAKAGEELRRRAEHLAVSVRSDAAADAEWMTRLDVLAIRGIDAESVAQARTMTPAAWLAWLAYDGEIDMSGVVPRS
ncbi:hypothetical protein [Microbacterium sp. NPDC057650]|uniref:hypothetical protein n=1 Tax=unclassified Microbacterium TaxID=2609290 RepID=UPI00366D2DCA